MNFAPRRTTGWPLIDGDATAFLGFVLQVHATTMR
jgi:hypothetical protein